MPWLLECAVLRGEDRARQGKNDVHFACRARAASTTKWLAAKTLLAKMSDKFHVAEIIQRINMHFHEKLVLAKKHLSEGRYLDSLNFVKDFLNGTNMRDERPDGIFSHYEAGGLLIDIGTDLSDLKIVEEGLAIIENKKFHKYLTVESREYNLGNAKNAIFDIQAKMGLRYSEEHLNYIIEAKNHYWRCLKNSSTDDSDFRYQIYVNMANSLDSSGRVTEALYLYALALHINPKRFEAHGAKAVALRWLNDLSEGYTPQLIFVMSYHLRHSIRLAPLQDQRNRLKAQLWACRVGLRRTGFSFKEFDRKHRFEYDANISEKVDFPSFCLNNGLFLSTHSAYCVCSAGQNDILTIRAGMLRVVQNRKLRAGINLTHLINRITADYITGRSYLYQSQVPAADFFPNMPADICLISAFRHTYSVFDKIAVALLVANNISFKPEEQILFESFWRRKPPMRELVFSAKNFNLIALYSIATDLSVKDGELRFFKEYRNLLEHSTMILTKAPIFQSQPGQIKRISRKQASEDLFALTRLARSAIHSLFLYIKTQFTKAAE